MLPPVAQGVQEVHGDHIPLVYAFFLLAAHQVTVKCVIANRLGGNTQVFRRDISFSSSGSSLVVSPILPSVHGGMVAASRQKREADIRVSTGTRKPAGIFRENMQYQQARGRILA